MKKRPLCYVCLAILIIQSVRLIVTGGHCQTSVPASSIFKEVKNQQYVTIQGELYRKSSTEKNQILYLKNNSIKSQNKIYYEPNIIIYDKNFNEIAIGQTVYLTGNISTFEKARNPGNFDQREYYAKQNIYGFVWCEEVLKIQGKEHAIQEKLYQIRQQWKEILLENLGTRNGAVLSAMLLGEKSVMDPEVKELYQKNGIAHVLAISGLHISFIGLGIYKLMRKTGAGFLVSGLVGIFTLSIYVLMIGVSVSVFRAYVMLILRIGADICGRVYDMATALFLAAALTIIYQPLYLTDAAFQLSYGAIAGILFVLPTLKILAPCKIAKITANYASMAINVCLFPIILWFYYEIPTYSFLWNLIVIPVTSHLLAGGMLGSFLFVVCKPIGKLILTGCGWILSFFEWIGELGCQLPYDRIVLGKPEWWSVLIYYSWLGLIFLYAVHLQKNNQAKGRRWWIVLTGIAVMLLFVKLPNGGVEITMVNVGQGDCFLVTGPKGKHYLVDGGSSDVEQVGKYCIEPFLKSQGVGILEYVFISHGDTDHCSGVLELIERQKFGIQIKTIVLPECYLQDEKLMELVRVSKQQGIRVAVIKQGMKLQEGELLWECIQSGSGLNGNAGSMVLGLHFRKFDMLFTGDVEAEGEQLLIANLKDETYDVLKVAHHGSKNSTTDQFLEITRPKAALISAGVDNSYGHPHQETLDRLRRVTNQIYQTKENGAVTVKTDGEYIDILNSSI